MCHDRGPRGVTIEERGVSRSRAVVSRCRGDRGSRCVTMENRAIEDRGVSLSRTNRGSLCLRHSKIILTMT